MRAKQKIVRAAFLGGLYLALAGACLALAGTAQAGGPFKRTLYNTFCTSLSGYEKTGCDCYLQWRIEKGYDRGSSLSDCIFNCTFLKADKNAIEACQKGCRETHEKDN